MSANSCTKLTIIATKGTLDWGYPPFILASTAAALGKDVSIFFTFYGLRLLLKDTAALKVSPIGNPDMPMKMPMGPDWFQEIDWGPIVPNAVWQLPFVELFATSMMKKTIAKNGVAPLAELRDLCQEAEVKFLACQMTVELFGFNTKEFIDGIDFVGAASYFEESSDSTSTQSLYM
ncbi:MAG: DsrE/DsrF/DrsH-like family protein [Gammaproteobacteria bacterium]|nr:DsrE/DsrF/DrsH-like family protein [Gammaproteobacteria bacterium]